MAILSKDAIESHDIADWCTADGHLNMPEYAVNADWLQVNSSEACYRIFQARQTVSINTIRYLMGNTTGGTVSSFRMGLYALTNHLDSPAGTLVARTADTPTAIDSTTSTWSAKSLALDTAGGYPSSYTIQKGKWYASGWVVGTTTSTPSVYGHTYPLWGGVAATSSGVQSSTTDLPTDLTGAAWVGEVQPAILFVNV